MNMYWDEQRPGASADRKWAAGDCLRDYCILLDDIVLYSGIKKEIQGKLHKGNLDFDRRYVYSLA